MVGYPSKPLNPVEKARLDHAQRLLKRNEDGWKGIDKMTEDELSDLEDETLELVDHNQLYRLYKYPKVIQDAFLITRAAVASERRRREKVRFDEMLCHDRTIGGVAFLLRTLSQVTKGQYGLADPDAYDYNEDDVLGPAPVVSQKVTAESASRMSDDELDAAMREALKESRAENFFLDEADSILLAIDRALPLAKEAKRRQSIYRKMRDVGTANYKLLSEESTRREKDLERAKAEQVDLESDLPAVVADLKRQVAELIGRK